MKKMSIFRKVDGARLAGSTPKFCLHILWFCLLLFSFQIVRAQHISGKVTDENSEGLPGVSVLEKGTTNGAVTDGEGKYSLKVSGGASATLVFSFVGYKAQTVVVGDRTEVSLSLVPENSSLNEVVVVGYGTQKKADLTGAVATVKGDLLNKRVVTNAASLMQGQLPGLQVIQNSGEPGAEGVNLKIRGIGTFSGAGTDPLVIVDGLPGSLTAVNPNDIESVSVLKDAASAAIYGARGANGVVVVTTKRGNSEGLSISYSYNNGITKATKLPEIISNSAEFMELSNEARVNSGMNPLYSQAQIDLYRNATDRNLYPNNNWLEDIMKTVNVQNHYLNINGSQGNTNYSIGLGYVDQPGVMKSFEYKKSTLQFNLNTKVNKFITFGTNTLFRYGEKQNSPQGPVDMFLSTLAQSPLYKPTLSDGSGRYTFRAYSNESGNKNPIAIAENLSAKLKDYYGQINGYININLLKGLVWETRAGANFAFWKTNDFRPKISTYLYSTNALHGDLDVGIKGLTVSQNNSLYTVAYSQLNYGVQLGRHHVSVLVGSQQEQSKDESMNAFRREFPTNILTELNAGPAEGQTNSGLASQWAIKSYYGRANYDFNSKYLFEASARYDGTSRLPKETRWGLFYAFSGGWRVTEEDFVKNITWLSDLKLRASWGRLGNQNIGTYPYQAVLSQTAYPFGSTLVTGFYEGGLVDPLLTWETTESIDFGLDAGLLNNRLTFSVDWFNKETFDILRGYQIPQYVGLGAPIINNGRLGNQGFEFEAMYQDKIGKAFSYRIGGNIQHYKNTLLQYGSKEIGGQTIREEGHSLDEFYMYQWDGIFQSQSEIDATAKHPIKPVPGDIKIKDVNGDGKIDVSDRTYTSGRYPIASYNLNLGANYKNFDFAAQLFGSFGQKIYVQGWGIEPFRQGSVPTTAWRNRWTPTNPSTTMPRIYSADSYPAISNYASTYFLQDASFIRLKNIQVGYSLPTSVISKVKAQSLRVYFSGENLWTLSKFPGIDPERTSVSGNYVSYPQNKVLTFGASIQF